MNKNQVQIIVNPISGGGTMDRPVAEVARMLRAAGCMVQVSHTQAAGDATRIARTCGDETRAVVAVGGDGTGHEVANGIL